jgi:hypothetical protein
LANDHTAVGRLEEVATAVETAAGVVPPSAQRDTTPESKIKRIADSLGAAFTGSGGGTIGSLDQLSDVAVSGPVKSHILEFDGTLFVNKLQALASHSDVSSALSPVSGNFFRHDGTDWKAADIALADLPTLDHGALTGLADDDHTQYLLADGTRALTANWNAGAFDIEAQTLTVTNAGVIRDDVGVNDVLELEGIDGVTFNTVSVLGDISFSKNANPFSDLFVSLGTAAQRWKDLYLGGTLNDGIASTVTIAQAKIAYDHSQDNTQAHSDYLLNNANDDNAGNTLTVGILGVDATVDHQITDSGDNLEIINGNSDGDIVFRINDGGTSHDLILIDASNPNIIIEPTGGATTLAGDGIIQIKGSWGRLGPYGLMRFNPTLTTGGTPIAFFVDPLISGPVAAFGISSRHTVASGQDLTHVGYEYLPGGNVSSGQTQTLTAMRDYRTISMVQAGTWNRVGAQLGVSAAGSTVHASAVVNDTHLSLHGGANAFLGSYTQYGIRMQGYGTGSATIHAIHSNGGNITWAANNAKLVMGATSEAELYYDASDFIIDPDAAGSGRVLIGTTGDDDLLLNEIEIDGPLNHDGSTAGFYGTTPVTQASALTTALSTITHTGPTTPDYAIATPVSGGWGFSTQDEFETVMSVIRNLQIRVGELEAALDSATGVGLLV